MTTGQPRREAVQDRLAGQAGMEPLTLQGPGLQAPPAIRAPDLTNVQRIAGQLAEWGGGKIEALANKQHEKDMLAGQMAYAQGQTLDEINMGGNKWALEGYKLIDAQTTSSSLLAAQQEEIAQGDYELSPDAFRDRYVARLDAALEGVDPATAALVREQMSAHVPALAAEHTTSNMKYTEQQAFDALERSFDIVSRDPTATDAMVAFATGGDDSPSGGLSDDRRKAATVAGVIRAFDNDNPLAFAALKSAGLLGDELDTDSQNALKAARGRFETRRRTEYDADLFNGEQAITSRVENGELEPPDAVLELSALYAEHGIRMDMADAGAIYSGAEAGRDTARKTKGLLLEEAALRGDTEAQAAILMGDLGQETTFEWEKHRTQGALREDSISGSDQQFVASVESMISSAPPEIRDGLAVFSGYRSIERQTELWEASDKSGKMVAKPGSSQHNHGKAFDLEWNGQRLDKAPQEVQDWVAANLEAHGLTRPMDYEPWHIEPIGARGGDSAMESLIVTESGGNPGAFRTNKDGKSFGGLLQMGDARLADWSNATGAPPITAVQYASLPPAQQKAIGKWHIQDLVVAANASGAIGTTINGVTVTLSGLVAVGHLGGKSGMEEFVRSGGKYNPADELGTTLTDYLSKHGAGDMKEFMSPTEKYERAKAARDQTRERLAMDTYAQTEPLLGDIDNAYVRGEIDRAKWKSDRDAVYGEYGRAVTAADVNHEVSTIKSATDYSLEVAKQTGDDNYKLGVEAASAALSIPKLAWEAVLNNPAATSAEVQAANQAYIAERGAIFDSYGIKAIDRKDGAETEQMVARTKGAMDKQKVFREEQADIDAAVNGGYVAELPKALQERAFKQMQDNTVKTYTEAAATGAMSEEAANASIAKDMNAGFAKMGVVDPKVARRMTAAVNGALVDKDGNPNPMVMDAIAQWAELKALNPRAADTMLSGEATARAEAILAKTGGDPSMIGEAVRDLGVDISRSPLVTDTAEFIARDDVQSGITNAVDAFLHSQDIGVFQAAWSDRADFSQTYDRGYTAADNIWTDDTKAAVHGEITEELSRLQRQNPNIKASDLVARAAENVERRTAAIGSDVVVLPAGQDFGKMFFGSRAGEFQHDGDVNSAVMAWLRAPGTQEQYGFISERTFAEGLPGFVQGGIDAIPFVNFDPAMSWTEAGDTDMTGVRPFRTFVTANREIAVEVLLTDGNYSEPIVVPAGQAGKLYMDQKRGEMTAEPKGRGVMPGLGGMGGFTMP